MNWYRVISKKTSERVCHLKWLSYVNRKQPREGVGNDRGKLRNAAQGCNPTQQYINYLAYEARVNRD